jgi:DNA-binding NtrC family response regulator
MLYDQEGMSLGELPPGSPGTIFVIEDNHCNGKLLVEILLRETCHHALLFRDGFLALKFSRFIKPLLFIIDSHLPQVDGVALYDQLHARKELRDVPAIIISASLEGHKDEIKKRKLVALSKPFDLDEFLTTVERTVAVATERYVLPCYQQGI